MGETGNPATSLEQDQKWFEQEVVGLLPDLYATAMRLAKNTADAEDLVAEAVSKAWDARKSLHDLSNFRGWIFRILMNTFLSDCRRHGAEPVFQSLPDECEAGDEFSLFDKLHQPFLLWWGNPEKEFLDRLLREDVEQAIDQLPVSFRAVVVLAELQGFSYQEIGASLNIPTGTVRSRLARGRCLLQQALWKHGTDLGLMQPPSRAVTRRTG